jgi:hypothetical protein
VVANSIIRTYIEVIEVIYIRDKVPHTKIVLGKLYKRERTVGNNFSSHSRLRNGNLFCVTIYRIGIYSQLRNV